MYETINLAKFTNAFKEIRPDNFTPEALELIYDFVTEYEEDNSMSVELDVIAICCDFTEMTESEIVDAYLNLDTNNVEQFLENQTLVLGMTSSGTYVFQSF